MSAEDKTPKGAVEKLANDDTPGFKRHKKKKDYGRPEDVVKGVSRKSIKDAWKKAGIVRSRANGCEPTRKHILKLLCSLIEASVILTEHDKKKTITETTVQRAAECLGLNKVY